MTQVVILGASSLLGHHLLALLAQSVVQVIAFLPENEALYFMEKYPNAKLAFLPREPETKEQVKAFMKIHPNVSHIVILGPHNPPTEAEYAAASKTLSLSESIQDPTLDAFSKPKSVVINWLDYLSGLTIILQSSLWACDAEDAMMNAKWKTFSHRDICIVTYKTAAESLENAERYTDAIVEHTFWSESRWVYPSGNKVALPTAPLTGPGIIKDRKYEELDFTHRKNMPLFIDARDAAIVYRNCLFSSNRNRELVAQGSWNEELFLELAKESNIEVVPREAKLEATCDTLDLQATMGMQFRNFKTSVTDMFEWLSS